MVTFFTDRQNFRSRTGTAIWGNVSVHLPASRWFISTGSPQESVSIFSHFGCFAVGVIRPILRSCAAAHRKANGCSGSELKKEVVQPLKGSKPPPIHSRFPRGSRLPSMRTAWFCFLSQPARYFVPIGRVLESGRELRRVKKRMRWPWNFQTSSASALTALLRIFHVFCSR